MADKKGLPEPRIPKIFKEIAQEFRREQTFASEDARAQWFARWDSIPFETRNELMMKYQISALSGKAPAELESIRKGIEDAVVQRVMSRFGAKYKDEARRELEREMRQTSTAMLNKLLEQELKRAAGDQKSEAARDAAQEAAENYAEAQNLTWTQGAKSEIQTKASYRPDPESFKAFSPEDVAAYTRKLDELKRKYAVSQLATKIQSIRADTRKKIQKAQDALNAQMRGEITVAERAGRRGVVLQNEAQKIKAKYEAQKASLQDSLEAKALALSSALSAKLEVEKARLGVSPDVGEEAVEKLRNEIILTEDALKRGGVGGFKVAVGAKKPVVVGQTIKVEKDDIGRKKVVVEEVYGMASPILPEGGGRGAESADARAFAARVRNQLVDDRVMEVLGLQNLDIEDLNATKEGTATLNRLRRQAAEELAPQIRAGTKGGASVAKASIYSEKAEREAIGQGKELAKLKMGKEAWETLSPEQKEQAGSEYADRFYKPFTIRVGPTGKSEDGVEFARVDPKASTLLNQKPQFFTPSGFGMKMRGEGGQGADKRVGRDLPNDAYADVELYKELLPRLGKNKAKQEASYLNPRWIAAAFGNDVLDAIKQRKAAQTSGFNITTQITKRDLEAVGFKMAEPKYQIVAPIIPTMYGQAVKEWHLAHMQREVDPTLARQIYANGKLLDVKSDAGKRALFMRGARATLYGAKEGGEQRIINEARRMAQEQMDQSGLYVGDSKEAKEIYDAKLEELTELAADLILSKEPAPTKSYNDKIRAFNGRLLDKSVRSVEEKTRAIRGKRIAKATPENKIEALAEDAVFDRYAAVAHKVMGSEFERDSSGRETGKIISSQPVPSQYPTQEKYLAANASWIKRFNEAFNRAAANLDADLAEEKSAIRAGARSVAGGTLIIRKKKDDGGQVSGLGFGFGSYDLGSQITAVAVGGLVVFSLFKAIQSGMKKA